MITGFNTDVSHEGHTYHVQTEDRGRENPVLESLVYVGGSVVAKKQTPYADKLGEGASEEAIAALLKKQHQVIIAAIKAGRLNELIVRSAESAPLRTRRPVDDSVAAAASSPATGPDVAKPKASAKDKSERARVAGMTEVDLDRVIEDYMKRTAEQDKLELKVITPDTFVGGKSVNLRVQVNAAGAPEADAVVTVKIIGTAFKPQVYVGRAGGDGLANFKLTLPAFTAGTAAIVIEAQSRHGLGELKHLIRRA